MVQSDARTARKSSTPSTSSPRFRSRIPPSPSSSPSSPEPQLQDHRTSRTIHLPGVPVQPNPPRHERDLTTLFPRLAASAAMSAPTPTTFPSVRVRRSATTVERPTLCPPVEGVVSDAPPLTTTSTSLGLTSGGNGRRRRGATLSERFFSPDAYVPLEGEETEGRETRRRAGSNASLGSGAGRVPSVVIHRGRGVSVGSVPGDEHHAEQEVDLVRLARIPGC